LRGRVRRGPLCWLAWLRRPATWRERVHVTLPWLPWRDGRLGRLLGRRVASTLVGRVQKGRMERSKAAQRRYRWRRAGRGRLPAWRTGRLSRTKRLKSLRGVRAALWGLRHIRRWRGRLTRQAGLSIGFLGCRDLRQRDRRVVARVLGSPLAHRRTDKVRPEVAATARNAPPQPCRVTTPRLKGHAPPLSMFPMTSRCSRTMRG
jgi:hypothetical protein